VLLPLSTQFDERYFAACYGNYFRQNPSGKLRFYRELLERHLPPSPSPRVLDLGCAFGLFLAGLPPEFRKFGVDASYHAISAAALRVPDAHFINADCGIPPISSRFDAIVAFDVLEHIPSADVTLEFVRRSLTPNGVFLFVVPVYDGPLGPIVRWLDRDPTHVHKRSREWWLAWTRRSFEVISWTGILRYLIARRFYVHLPSTAIRRVAPAIAVVSRPRPIL
jgi:SAM-dependent methyltransferase